METEALIEKIELMRLYKLAADAVAQYRLNPTTRNGAILTYRSEAFNIEYSRIYGNPPDEEEEIIYAIEHHGDYPPEKRELTVTKPDDPRNEEGGSDNPVGGI